MVDILDAAQFLQTSLKRMTRRNYQQRKEPEIVASATDLIDMDIRKMSEIDFRVAI